MFTFISTLPLDCSLDIIIVRLEQNEWRAEEDSNSRPPDS